jgi:hypothetical protein
MSGFFGMHGFFGCFRAGPNVPIETNVRKMNGCLPSGNRRIQ